MVHLKPVKSSQGHMSSYTGHGPSAAGTRMNAQGKSVMNYGKMPSGHASMVRMGAQGGDNRGSVKTLNLSHVAQSGRGAAVRMGAQGRDVKGAVKTLTLRSAY